VGREIDPFGLPTILGGTAAGSAAGPFLDPGVPTLSDANFIPTQPWERTHAAWTQATGVLAIVPFAGLLGVVASLVLWLQKRDTSAYIDDHGREALNLNLTAVVYGMIGLMLIPISIPLLVVLGLVWLVALVRGVSAAREGRLFRYPVCLRFVK
jgi:uncharacterized Tic20 family protein